MSVRVQKLIKMFFRNTLVAHKWLVKPYFMRFTVQQALIGWRERIKIAQKPRKIKVFRGFLIPKQADIV